MMEELNWGGHSGRWRRIRECPACGKAIQKNVAGHIAAHHGPEDFGLSPLGSATAGDSDDADGDVEAD